MDLEITIEDPKYYTHPFNMKAASNLLPDSDILQYVCLENEKDMGILDQARRNAEAGIRSLLETFGVKSVTVASPVGNT